MAKQRAKSVICKCGRAKTNLYGDWRCRPCMAARKRVVAAMRTAANAAIKRPKIKPSLLWPRIGRQKFMDMIAEQHAAEATKIRLKKFATKPRPREKSIVETYRTWERRWKEPVSGLTVEVM